MAEAIYTGSAARYMIGGVMFERDVPKEVNADMAKYLATLGEFKLDGKGGVATKSGDAPAEYAVIPSVGFKTRDEVKAFADKWLPDLVLPMTRSVTELQRRVEAAMRGLTCDDEGYPVEAGMAAATVAQVAKAKGKAVAV